MPAAPSPLVHVLALPTEGVASHVGAQLREEGFDPVDVLADGDRWVVRVADPRLPSADGSAAVEGLKARFEALAEEHDGSYEPYEG